MLHVVYIKSNCFFYLSPQSLYVSDLKFESMRKVNTVYGTRKSTGNKDIKLQVSEFKEVCINPRITACKSKHGIS